MGQYGKDHMPILFITPLKIKILQLHQLHVYEYFNIDSFLEINENKGKVVLMFFYL